MSNTEVRPGGPPPVKAVADAESHAEHGLAIRTAARAFNEAMRAAAADGVGTYIETRQIAEGLPERLYEVRVEPYVRL
jgi:hypothetical protein